MAGSDQWAKRICRRPALLDMHQQLQQTYLNAQLMSNAPLQLVTLTQQGWQRFVQRCRSDRCIRRQYQQRIDELNRFTRLNQRLTQHYVRLNGQRIFQPFTHLQVQQLAQNRIKIEGTRYADPNRSIGVEALRAYGAPDQLQQLTDLEHRCQFGIKRFEQGLQLSSRERRCQAFVGLYRLVD